VEKYFLNKKFADKPFFVKKYVVSRGFTLQRLRKKCNEVFSACFLVGTLIKTKILARKFSVMTKIESERLTRSILKDLKNKTWPTDCTIKRKAVKAYIQNVQNQTLIVKKKCQLNFISSHFFNIKNRIFAIDSIFNESKSRSYNQVGFRTSTSKVYKFILLNQTKLSNLSKLPQHKVILVEIPKTNNHKKSLCLSMPVDKILQCMFLNFLDVIIEDKLKSNVFAFRKGRNARMAAAAVYFKLSQAQYLEQICVCSIKIKKCFDTIRHDKILEHY
jgi:retron-type reverse transcriptase